MQEYSKNLLKYTLREKISFEGTAQQYFDSLIDSQIHRGINSIGNFYFNYSQGTNCVNKSGVYFNASV